MPFGADGLFKRLFNWRDDQDDGIKIRADRMDQEMDGIVAGLNDVIQGNASFKGPVKVVGGTADNPSFSFSDNPNTGFFRKADGNIGLSVNGEEIGAFPVSLFEHESKTSNPHNVTAEQVGAVPVSDYSAENILSKLISVHGEGSGVDADLLDGQHGNFYLNAANLNAGILSSSRLPIATQEEAETAEDNTKLLTPLRTKQLVEVLLSGSDSLINAVEELMSPQLAFTGNLVWQNAANAHRIKISGVNTL